MLCSSASLRAIIRFLCFVKAIWKPGRHTDDFCELHFRAKSSMNSSNDTSISHPESSQTDAYGLDTEAVVGIVFGIIGVILAVAGIIQAYRLSRHRGKPCDPGARIGVLTVISDMRRRARHLLRLKHCSEHEAHLGNTLAPASFERFFLILCIV